MSDASEIEPADRPADADRTTSQAPVAAAVRAATLELLRHGLLEEASKPNLYRDALLHRDAIDGVLASLALAMRIDDVRGLAFVVVSTQPDQEDEEWTHPLVRRQRLNLEQSLLVAILRQQFVAHEVEAGIGADDVEQLMRRRVNKMLPPDDARVSAALDRSRFWQPADVFVSAAISESILPDTLGVLERAGVGVIACGSNQPFREVKIGSTRVAQNADRRFTVLADILANCGMARTFSYLMEPQAETHSEAIFRAVTSTIDDTLDEVLDRAADARTGLLSATLGLALDRIGA